MIKVKSLYHLILYSIIFIILLTSSFTFIIINNAFNEFQEKIEIIKSDYFSKQRDLIKAEINSTLKFIEYSHDKQKGLKSEEDIKSAVLNSIELMKDSREISKNIFVYQFDGTLIYYPISKNRVGQNFYEFTDPSGKKVIKEIVEVSQKKGGGFVQYIWYKPSINDDALKMSYALSYKPWNWTIGTGIYLDEIDEVIKKKEMNMMKKSPTTFYKYYL